MRLTTKGEYSLLALIYIARQGRGNYVKIEEICQAYDLPRKYLEHLLLILKQNRYLKTRRGSKGGYALAMPPSKISIAQIIRLMDGALAPTEAVSMYFFSKTRLSRESKLMAIFKDIRDYAARKLERLKLSQVT